MTNHPPPTSAFAAYPACWYLFCGSSELGRKPLSKTMLGRLLVGYRTASGRVVLMDGRCSHLGADLGRGTIVGDALRCPFHHWEYRPDGRCSRIPAQTTIPSFARQVTYPVAERHGFVFFFNAREASFTLPFFADADPDDFVAGEPFRVVAECSWYMLAANGFDVEHFEAVHDRKLTAPPTVDMPAPHARRMRYHALVTGGSIFDVLLRASVGREVDVSITSWGGPFIFVTGFFQKARSYILIATQPLGPEITLIELIVLAHRCRLPAARLLLPLELAIRRWFTRGFLQDDINRLGGIHYNPHTLIEADRLLVEYFHWAAGLPEGWGGAVTRGVDGQLRPVAAVRRPEA
jgi:nitrite reductase/ring-hydroxylating ferredoxin subunit